MRTDTLFYQLFNAFHSLLFELIERPISEAEGYEFSSVEVKEKAFRFDGIFIPKAKDKPIYLLEVQFQQKEDFYWEYLSEIYLYLNQSHDQLAVCWLASPHPPPLPFVHTARRYYRLSVLVRTSDCLLGGSRCLAGEKTSKL